MVYRCVLQVHAAEPMVVIAFRIVFALDDELPRLLEDAFILIRHLDIHSITLCHEILVLTRRKLLYDLE